MFVSAFSFAMEQMARLHTHFRHIPWLSDGSVVSECGSEWVRCQTVALVEPPWSAVDNNLNLWLKLSSLNSGLYSLLHSTVLVVHKYLLLHTSICYCTQVLVTVHKYLLLLNGIK
jgi:hypothetical protein